MAIHERPDNKPKDQQGANEKRNRNIVIKRIILWMVVIGIVIKFWNFFVYVGATSILLFFTGVGITWFLWYLAYTQFYDNRRR